MGWKTFYSVDESYFRDLYNKGQKWGEMLPYQVTRGGEVRYGAGIVSSQPTPYYQSPKQSHVVGYKTRFTITYFVWVGASTTCEVGLGIVFYQNGDTAKDEQGYDLHGASHTVSQPPSTNVAEPHTMVIEQDANKITISVDGQKIDECVLRGTLASFTIAVRVFSVSANGSAGIIITSVKAEYYDAFEDMINSMMQIMNIMMFVMIAIMFVVILIRAFRGRKEEKG